MSSNDDDDPTSVIPVAQPENPDEVAAPVADEEDIADEEVQDYRKFSASLSLSKKHQVSKQTIRRGEKDFESHGTRLQENALEASRNAMHDVLSFTRTHRPQNTMNGYYFPEHWSDEEIEDESGYVKRDRIVVLENDKGPMLLTTGRTPKGVGKNVPAWNKTWLLPEEALFLVERGDMLLWLPRRGIHEVFPVESDSDEGESEESEEAPIEQLKQDHDPDVPLSLQAAYALFIGNDGERGKISLEKYQVYSSLKRQGYAVFRATSSPEEEPVATQSTSIPPQTLWQWLFSLLTPSTRPRTFKHMPLGPLVQPGFYRSYNAIYRSLELIQRHKPTPNPTTESPQDPFKVAFHVYQTRSSKVNPGPPDFRMAVVNTQTSSVPTLHEMTSLIEPTPWDPPMEKNGVGGKGLGFMYKRLKHGWRNVIIAIVDRGFITYLNTIEAAFGEEKLYDTFDNRGKIGSKSSARGKQGGRGGMKSNGGRRGG